MRLIRSALAAALGLSFAAVAAEATTLRDAFAAAYANNPTLAAQRAQLRATDENVPQALSGWRPTVILNGTVGAGSSKTTGRDTATVTPNTQRLEITQPLYRGGRTVNGTMQAESQVKSGREALRATEQDVLLATVTTYMNVLRDQARVALNSNNEDVLRRQLEASQDRFEVGEVTRTDVAQSEARLSRAVSARVSAEGDLAISRATYLRVVGEPGTDLQPAPPLPPLPATKQEAIEFGIASNPTLSSSLHNETTARHAARVAFGSVLPTLNLVGRLSRTDETSIEDSSTESGTLTAEVSIPLYQSGSVHSQVRQAKETRNQRRVQIEEARRSVVESVTQAWEDLKSSEAVIRSREEEVRANSIALEGVRQEAAVGSRTTLAVLDAEQELLDASVNLVIAERDQYVAAFRLLAAMGQMAADKLNLPVELYNPMRHYNLVRDKWFGWNRPDVTDEPDD